MPKGEVYASGSKAKTLGEFVRRMASDWREGARASFQNTATRRLLIGQAFASVAVGLNEAFAVPFQQTVIGFSNSVVSLVRALNRVSGICANLLIYKLEDRIKPGTFLSRAPFLVSAGYLLEGIAHPISNIVGAFAANFGRSLIGPDLGSALARNVATDQQGRVESFRSLLRMCCVLLGNALAVPVVAGLGFFCGYVTMAAMFVVSCVVWKNPIFLKVDES